MPEQKTDAERIAELEDAVDQHAKEIEAMHLLMGMMCIAVDASTNKNELRQMLNNAVRHPSLWQTETMASVVQSITDLMIKHQNRRN